MKDFFISYSNADLDRAKWIVEQLESIGNETFAQFKDMPAGSNFMAEMHDGIKKARRFVAVLSPDYLISDYCQQECFAALRNDPLGKKRSLIFVRVRPCEPKSLFGPIVYIDLVGKTDEEAAAALLAGIEGNQITPDTQSQVDKLLNSYFALLEKNVSRIRLFDEAEKRELEEVFVELTINEEYDRRPNQAEFLGLMDSELRRMRSVFGDADQYRDREGADDSDHRHFAKTKRTVKPDELLRRHTHAVVTGAPGCGKTTLLRYLAWQTLKQWRTSEPAFGVPPSGGKSHDQALPPEGGTPNAQARFPVFLEFKKLDEHACQSARNKRGQLEFARLVFDQAVAELIVGAEEHEYEALFPRFRSWLTAGKVAIFLDGLDEVNGRPFFTALRESVNRFLTAYGANTIIISTRPFALPKFSSTKELEILPLNPRQIEQFITHYYHDMPERQRFQRELQRRRELRELARVPALLGFILQLWRKNGSVTDDKLELYKRITEELAGQLDSDKAGEPKREFKVPDTKRGKVKLEFARHLAFAGLFKGIVNLADKVDKDAKRLIFDEDTIFAEATIFARQFKADKGVDINPLDLAEDITYTAMLRQVGGSEYAFAHLTLQEYLAAWQLANRHDAATCERIFCRAYFNPTLAEMEVLPMTLGLVDDPDKFYEALERLPESLSLTGFRLRARGLGYAYVSQQALKALIDSLDRLISLDVCEERGYHDAVLKAYANARGENLRLILRHIAQSLAPDKDNYERENAVEALALFHHESAAMLLRKALADKHDDVRIRAAAAMGWCDLDCTIDALKKELKSPDEETRKNVVHTVWQLVGEQAIEVLIEALGDKSATVIEEAVEALGDVGGKKVVGLLIDVLQTDSGHASEKAAEALAIIGGDEALNGLLNGLEQPSCKARQQIIEALGEIGDARAVPSLLKIVKNAQSYDRKEAVKALGKIKCDRQIISLKKLFSEIKAKWAEQLCETDRESGFVFGEDYESLLIALAESLLSLGENSGLEFLLDILERGEGDNTADAVKVLANIDSDIVNTALQTAWDKTLSKYSRFARIFRDFEN